MQRRFRAKQGLNLLWHSLRRKNDDWGNVGLKNLQSIVDLALIRDDYPQRRSSLSTLRSRLSQFIRDTEPDVVAFECAMSDQNGIGQCALSEQMRLIFARSEIDRRKIACRDFAIDRHRKSRAHKWTRRNVGAAVAPRMNFLHVRRVGLLPRSLLICCRGSRWLPNVIIGTLTASPTVEPEVFFDILIWFRRSHVPASRLPAASRASVHVAARRLVCRRNKRSRLERSKRG